MKLHFIHRENTEIACKFSGQRGGKWHSSLFADHQTRDDFGVLSVNED